jgi:hypothetical protein
VVAGGLIPRGEVLTAAMLAFKRTDVRFAAGIAPKEADRLIGRRAAISSGWSLSFARALAFGFARIRLCFSRFRHGLTPLIPIGAGQ